MALWSIISWLLVAGCGGSAAESPTVDPAPVAPLPEAAAGGEEVEAARREPEPAEPEPAPTGGQAIVWFAEHRNPDGAVQTWDLRDGPLLARVAGWTCRIRSARSGTQMRIVDGQVEQWIQESRELHCADGSSERAESVSCGHGIPNTPPMDSVSISIDDNGRPHEVVLRCQIELTGSPASGVRVRIN